MDLDDGWGIALSVPWRIVAESRIAFADEDDGQMFGRSALVDGEAEARRLLTGKRIVQASVDRQTADLTLRFDPDARLDAFNNSSGYEGWQAYCCINGGPVSIVALGGGGITIF